MGWHPMESSLNGKLGKNGCHHIIICIIYACVSCYTYIYTIYTAIVNRYMLYVKMCSIVGRMAYGDWCDTCIAFYLLHTFDITSKVIEKER